MALRPPPIRVPLLQRDGTADTNWYRFFLDLPVRIGGDADLKITANATGYTVTFIEPDGTVHAKTTAW